MCEASTEPESAMQVMLAGLQVVVMADDVAVVAVVDSSFVSLVHGMPVVCGGRRLTKEGPYTT